MYVFLTYQLYQSINKCKQCWFLPVELTYKLKILLSISLVKTVRLAAVLSADRQTMTLWMKLEWEVGKLQRGGERQLCSRDNFFFFPVCDKVWEHKWLYRSCIALDSATFPLWLLPWQCMGMNLGGEVAEEAQWGCIFVFVFLVQISTIVPQNNRL